MPLIAEASRDARWSTSDFSSDQAGSRWMELLSKSIATMHVDSLDRKPFSASRRRIGLGPIDLNILEASSQRVQRTRSMISRQKPTMTSFICRRERVNSNTAAIRSGFRRAASSCWIINNPMSFCFPTAACAWRSILKTAGFGNGFPFLGRLRPRRSLATLVGERRWWLCCASSPTQDWRAPF